jgi:hypothetical protein
LLVSSCAPLLKQVLDVDTGGDQLRALLCHVLQQRLTLLIDKRDLIEVDNALTVFVTYVGLSPISSQFRNPQPNQTTLQNPFLFCRRFGSRNLQHVRLFRLANCFTR